jgi:predicted HTH transcriptional regulator
MKIWEQTCIDLLHKSLLPTNPQELNEIDWKQDISNSNENISKHLSAFSNYSCGGYIVFGVDNGGSIIGVDKQNTDEILKKLGNIARNNLEPQIALEHSILTIENKTLLAVCISESTNKPVHIKSGTIYDAYTRSAGESRKLSKEEIQKMVSVSQGFSFENRLYLDVYQVEDIISKLDYVTYFDLTGIKQPTSQSEIMKVFESELLIKKRDDGYQMTNLGIILFAKNLNDFKELKRKAPRVIVYEGKNRVNAIKKQNEGNLGYAAGFTRLIEYVNTLLPSNEVIQQALRKEVRMYPERAIRELIANALIHQDFDVAGTGVTIEMFDDRIEITNPGKPFVEVNRLMDLPPRSRNEKLASLMRRLHICEELGSGIDKVVFECEVYQLPAPLFETKEDNMIATLYSHQTLTKMDKKDRIRACYLHASLKHVSGEITTNESIRTRFNILDSNYPIASKILKETMEAGFVKPKDPDSKSKRHSQYVPFWA